MRFAESRKIPKCVREEEFIQLIKVIPKKDYLARISFLLAYGSGMRLSEVLECSKEHFKGNTIFISGEYAKYGVDRMITIPKGWKEEFFNYLPIGKTKRRTVQRKFEKYRDKANLPKNYTFHSLRHGFATRSLERGIPLNQLQGALGHANLQTTSIYTKANPKDLIDSYEKYF